ncbi:MAG: chemotaxis protein MotB [Microbacteriaceae bacterium]|nr:chemotaxis protein MotB [Microbacteriaceae bacterium]
MSARPTRRSKTHDEEPHNGERWMASYMDMVTVLMCLFIVLFAMSSVDHKKFDQLKNSLAAGFGVVKGGTMAPVETTTPTPQATVPTTTDAQLAAREVNDLAALQAKISAALAAKGLSGTVQFGIDARGLTVRLVGPQTFFGSNSAALTAPAVQILDAIGPVLATTTYNVSVEGHADSRQPGYPFPTNWELASGRATAVLRHFVENDGMAAERIQSVSFGSARPATSGTTPDDLALNRRVDIVVLSNQPDRVRALIPGIVADKATPGP